MTNWTLLLCEGAHDQKAIVALARVCRNWQSIKGTPNSLPPVLKNTYPDPVRDESTGAWRFRRAPDYLVQGNRYLVVHNLGGVRNVLGQPAIDYLEQLSPAAVGILVDADEPGVDDRVRSFRDWYGRLYDHAGTVSAGSVSAHNPRLGLWVAPNNRKNGDLSSLLVTSIGRSKKRLVATGRRFTTSLARTEPGKWVQHRDKAVLGAIHQVVAPGASLAVSLEKNSAWFEAGLANVPPFNQLLRFIDRLTDT